MIGIGLRTLQHIIKTWKDSGEPLTTSRNLTDGTLPGPSKPVSKFFGSIYW